MKNVIICWIIFVFSFNACVCVCVCVCVCLEEYEIKNRMTLYDIVDQWHPFIWVTLKFYFNA